jgi:hypothetical protein
MGGKSAPAPDYTPMAAISKEQLDFAKRQYAEMAPIARQIAGLQMQAQTQQMQQAQDYYDYQKGTFRPVEQGLVRDAQAFNSEAYREQLARDAAAASAQAFGQTQAMASRAAAARGINPNSGAALAMQNQNMLGLSAQRAQAMTGARTQAEQMGWARRMDVTGLGRNLAGASTAAYQGATGAGTSGMNTSMAPGAQYQAGLANAGQTAGGVLNAQTSAYNTGINATGEMYGSIFGGSSQIGAAGLAKYSDRRLKEDIKLIGVDERTGLNLYEFVYKGGSSTKYIGVMADEAKETFPHAVFTMPDGYDAVNYEALGIEFKQA